MPGPVADVGAVYLLDGATLAIISTLTGSVASDQVGNGGIRVLTNGNFVVMSSGWDDGALVNVGAVTWCSGTTGLNGVVSAANSLVGSTTSDFIGSVTALTNGNYVVNSLNWDNGAAVNAGAVTCCNGLGGTVGVVSPANSLVGSTTDDRVPASLTALSNGNYVVLSPRWDNAGIVDAGAAILGNGNGGTVGPISVTNSLVGTSALDRTGARFQEALFLRPLW